MSWSGPVVRLFVYCLNYRPPLSIWGRIATGRFIIPGYDQVLVAPLVALVTGWALLPLMIVATSRLTTLVPAAVSLQLMVLLNFPPSFERWRLTGHHRIRPMAPAARELTKL